MIDHDRLFKELLTHFVYEFIELMLPELHEGLEPGSIEFLDKEMFTELGLGQRREADLVAKARVRGADAFFIFHVEHQAQHQFDFPRRMFRYYSILFERHEIPIYPVALLSYPSPQDPAPSEYRTSCFGLETLVFKYRVLQLNRMDWHDYIRRPNPVAAALISRMNIAQKDRPRVKLACLRLLANLNLDRARSTFVSGFIEQYLTLDSEEKREFAVELIR